MRRVLTLLYSVFLLCLVAYSQGEFGTIGGRVIDPAGAGVPAATVEAVNVATSERVKTPVDAFGGYEFLQLKPGEYRVEVTAPGFKKLERSGITVHVADRITLDLPVQIGQNTETVSVTADAPLLRTQDAQVGDIIDQNAIMNLPVVDHEPLELLRLSSNFAGSGKKDDTTNRLNGGRPLGLEYYVDGVAVETGLAHGVSTSTPTMQGTSEFKVVSNGISAEYGRMSGGYVELVTKSGTNQIHGQLFEYDQNRVFNANSWGQNLLGADKPIFQYNLFGGAVGGPIYIPKVFDGRNKTFFYFDYQGTRFNQAGLAQTASLPTQAMRNGDFTGVQVNGVQAMLYDQKSPLVCSSNGKPYDSSCVFDSSDPNAGPVRTGLIGGDGKHVPSSQFDPISVAIQSLLPLPNRPADPSCSFCNNYEGFSNSNYNDDRYAGRIDHSLTDNQKIFGRFTYQNYANNVNTRWWGPLQAPQVREVKGASNLTLNYTWSKSPTFIVEARLGYYFNPNSSGGKFDQSTIDKIPLAPIMRELMGPTALPWTVVPTMGSGNALIDNGGTSVTNSSTYQANLAMTKVLQRHTLKFGYEHRRYYDNFLSPGGAWLIADGDSVRRTAVDSPWTNDSFADGYGAFLLGQADHMQASGYTTRAMNFNYHAAYLQDDFKVSPKLTLNLGIRWEMETPVTERHDKLYFWDPTAQSPFQLNPNFNWNSALVAAGVDPSQVQTPDWVKRGALPSGAIVAANTPQHTSRYGPGYQPLHFSPRIGAAYQLSSKTVIRASVGQMYISSSGNASALSSGGSGFALADSIPEEWHYPTSLPLNDTLTFSNPVTNPNQVVRFTHDSTQANYQVTGGQAIPVVYSLNSHMPSEWDYHVSVQHQFSGSMIVELQFNGNRGVGLLIPSDISTFPKALFQPQNANLYGANSIQSPFVNSGKWGTTQQLAFLEFQYPQYGPVRLLGANDGRSQYNAFVIRTEKRMSKGISFLASYTYSLLRDNTGGPNVGTDITNASGTGGRDVQSVDQPKDFFTTSPLDQTHRASVAFTAELPIGRGRALLGHPQSVGGRVLDYVVGGWQVGGIYTATSGTPLILGFNNGQIGNSYGRIINTWGSYATSNHDLSESNFSSNSQVFVPTSTDLSTITVRRLDPTLVKDAGLYTYGNLNPVYDKIRQPAFFNTDLSVMKNFNFSEGRRYFQLRVEAQNAFNQRGLPGYSATVGTPQFGLLVGDPNNPWRQPRIMQFSGRIVF